MTLKQRVRGAIRGDNRASRVRSFEVKSGLVTGEEVFIEVSAKAKKADPINQMPAAATKGAFDATEDNVTVNGVLVTPDRVWRWTAPPEYRDLVEDGEPIEELRMMLLFEVESL
jgi:hypothetical protein